MSDADAAVPADDGALERLLRERRSGPPAPDETTPWDFVYQWSPAVVEKRVWPIVSRLLLDADEMVRARAVEFVRLWRNGAAMTTPRLLDVAQRHAALFADQRPEGIPLRDEMAHALADRSSRGDGPQIASVLKRLAADEPVGGGAASVLGEQAPEFVTAQVKRWGDGAIDWLEEAARTLAMFRRDAILPFLTAARGLSDGNRERLVAAVDAYVKRDDALATTIAQTEGLPPPTQPAPSTAECRRAIGL
jgi:hypothetical protein